MIDIDVSWLVPLRWPLTIVLVALAVYFWRRGPERNEPWRPPEPAGEDRTAGPSGDANGVTRGGEG